MNTKKYISPGGWFSLCYPVTWNEFEDEEGSFLFYNPEKWSGNFRISANKDRSDSYAKESVQYELEHNDQAVLREIGPWKCAYSCETFMEGNEAYTSHFWITGKGKISVECSFTVKKGSPVKEAEDIIASLEIGLDRKKYSKEIIPIRVLEINEVNMAYEWISSQIKKTLKKDFTASLSDIDNLQKMVDSQCWKPQQQDAWIALGLTFGVILVNEMDGMDWITMIDENNELPALRYGDTDLIVFPMNLFADKVKKGEKCNLRKEFDRIKNEIESRL